MIAATIKNEGMMRRWIKDLIKGGGDVYAVERDVEGLRRTVRELGDVFVRTSQDFRDAKAENATFLQRLAEVERSMVDKIAEVERGVRLLGPRYTMLPASPYAQVAIPLDYPPSRDYQPRWGALRPPLAFFTEWFGQYNDLHAALLSELRSSVAALRSIPRTFDHDTIPTPGWLGIAFSPLDAAAIYMMVRHYRPNRFLEIGSGASTCFAHRAIQDHHLTTDIISIDPSPRAAIDKICSRTIRNGLETCDLSVFDVLEPNDIVFMDGSHRSFMNSDVTVFLLDVLPRLKPGVIIHVHDIVLPSDYHPAFSDWYWNEQYMLATYMMNAAHRITPLFPTAFVCANPLHAETFATPLLDLGEAKWNDGGSMWFTHTAPLLVPQAGNQPNP